MSSIFYDHLVDWEAAEAKIRQLTTVPEEHAQLVEILDQTTQHELFAVIFTVLPERAHESFVQSFHAKPHSHEHLATLRIYAPDIEVQLREAANAAHTKFFDAIHQ